MLKKPILFVALLTLFFALPGIASAAEQVTPTVYQLYHNFAPVWSHPPGSALPQDAIIWADFGVPVRLADPDWTGLIQFGVMNAVGDARLARYQRPEYPTRIYWRPRLSGGAADAFGDISLPWPAVSLRFTARQADILPVSGQWATAPVPWVHAQYTFLPASGPLQIKRIAHGPPLLVGEPPIVLGSPQLGRMSSKLYLLASEPVMVQTPAAALVRVTHPAGEHTASRPFARHERTFAYYAPALDRVFNADSYGSVMLQGGVTLSVPEGAMVTPDGRAVAAHQHLVSYAVSPLRHLTPAGEPLPPPAPVIPPEALVTGWTADVTDALGITTMRDARLLIGAEHIYAVAPRAIAALNRQSGQIAWTWQADTSLPGGSIADAALCPDGRLHLLLRNEVNWEYQILDGRAGHTVIRQPLPVQQRTGQPGRALMFLSSSGDTILWLTSDTGTTIPTPLDLVLRLRQGSVVAAVYHTNRITSTPPIGVHGESLILPTAQLLPVPMSGTVQTHITVPPVAVDWRDRTVRLPGGRSVHIRAEARTLTLLSLDGARTEVPLSLPGPMPSMKHQPHYHSGRLYIPESRQVIDLATGLVSATDIVTHQAGEPIRVESPTAGTTRLAGNRWQVEIPGWMDHLAPGSLIVAHTDNNRALITRLVPAPPAAPAPEPASVSLRPVSVPPDPAPALQEPVPAPLEPVSPEPAPPAAPELAPAPVEPAPAVEPVSPAPGPVPASPIYGTVKGRVTDLRGTPLEGIRVELRSVPQVTFTNQLGEYRFENVLLGEHTVTLLDAATLREFGRIDVTVDETTRFKDTYWAKVALTPERKGKRVDFAVVPFPDPLPRTSARNTIAFWLLAAAFIAFAAGLLVRHPSILPQEAQKRNG